MFVDDCLNGEVKITFLLSFFVSNACFQQDVPNDHDCTVTLQEKYSSAT